VAFGRRAADNETIGATCRCNCPSGIRSILNLKTAARAIGLDIPASLRRVVVRGRDLLKTHAELYQAGVPVNWRLVGPVMAPSGQIRRSRCSDFDSGLSPDSCRQERMPMTAAMGRVSRASSVHTAMRNYTGRKVLGVRQSGVDLKPPQAAVVKSQGGERCGKGGT
jgi:hypothetical protein